MSTALSLFNLFCLSGPGLNVVQMMPGDSIVLGSPCGSQVGLQFVPVGHEIWFAWFCSGFFTLFVLVVDRNDFCVEPGI